MEPKYVVVQAGGRGSRLETLTLNKPKCLVPVDNLPMIFHLFKKYPTSKFLIIADYKRDVLDRYLEAFADVSYEIVATTEKGTCSGLQDAMKLIPEAQPFVLSWCDLILADSMKIPEDKSQNYVGISKDFECRWSYKEKKYVKEPSSDHGVAGFFVFKSKRELAEVPTSGEFVFWLSQTKLSFQTLSLAGSREVGTVLSYYQSKINVPNCRPFNLVKFHDSHVEKLPLDDQGRKLAVFEEAWYKKVTSLGFKKLPEVYSYSPLKIERIVGKNVYEYNTLTFNQKKEIVIKIIANLRELHHLDGDRPANRTDCVDNYITKTFERLKKVTKLVPFADQEFITINGQQYRNVLFFKDDFSKTVEALFPSTFTLIHGDPTFSNTILETEKIEPYFIDPRGYFGSTQYYGDPNYDWAKLYYSIVGNYDQFNMKKFTLEIEDSGVSLKILSTNWEDMEDVFFSETLADKKTIRTLHALIWLSLTTYAWEDYDSICGAFYNGLVHLKKAME